MTDHIRVALAQTNTIVGDLAGNCEKIVKNIRAAESAGADILLFPELTIPSYLPEDLVLKSQFVADNKAYLERVAPESRALITVVGFIDDDPNNGKIYNAAAILANGTIQKVYHKICLPNYSVFDEKRYFVPGDRPLVFQHNGIKFGVNICEDMWVPDGVTECQTHRGGAEVVLSISASPYDMVKRRTRLEMAQARAVSTRSIIVLLNLVGGQDELVFDGGSMVLNHEGEVTARCRQFREDFLVADLDVAELKEFRRQDKQYQETAASYKPLYRPEIITIKSKTPPEPKPPLAAKNVSWMGRHEEIYEALTLGTCDYVRKNGFEKAVIGLSGGIDSALTAAIAVEALGPDNVIGVLLPSEITSKESIDDALQLAHNLGILTKTIAINEVFDAYVNSLHSVFAGLPRDITEENLQARARGNILMALSNKFGWLVLTTGNKSETSVGYATLYGDMAGGFAVIKDVPKTMVYELCKYVNSRSGREVIPVNILTKAPTAELRPNQKDEDSLPPYDQLDAVLEQLIEKDKTVQEISEMGYAEEMVRRIAHLVNKNEYKRRQAAPGVKITPRAFGKDRRWPITNRYED